jgi:methyltransferase
MSWAAVAILAFVTAQRLFELWLANRNTRRLLADGAVEHGRAHYPLIVGLHAAWLGALWLLAVGRPIDLVLLIVFGCLQLGRIWVIASLGPRWTTRIIVVPGESLVMRGPYRFIRHPNYVIVTLEIAILPLVFGLAWVALVFSVLNAALLAIRISAEDRALLDS